MGGVWGERGIREVDLDLVLANPDPLDYVLYDLPAVGKRKFRPADIEGACFGGKIGGGDLLDLQEVDLA